MDIDSRTLSDSRTPSFAASIVAGTRCAILVVGAVLALAALTALGAYIRIPLQPVPITLQTLFVLLAGALAGARRGSLSQSLYLAGGVLGVPLFAGSAVGLAVLTGPTGGYLVGFVVAPIVIGRLIGRGSGFGWNVFVFSLGSAVILFLGALHLTLFTTGDFAAAFRLGVVPFIAGDAAKTLAAASIYGTYRQLRARRAPK